MFHSEYQRRRRMGHLTKKGKKVQEPPADQVENPSTETEQPATDPAPETKKPKNQPKKS